MASTSTGSKLLNSAMRAAVHVNSARLPKELAKSSAAFLSSAPSGGKHTLPDLAYDYSALERESVSTMRTGKDDDDDDDDTVSLGFLVSVFPSLATNDCVSNRLFAICCCLRINDLYDHI